MRTFEALPTAEEWHELNQYSLLVALARVRDALEAHVHRTADDTISHNGASPLSAMPPDLAEMGDEAEMPPALAMLCATFDLSPFERDLLLLCAGVELDSSLTALCAEAHGDPSRPYPTFGLALSALPGVHWDAFSPAGPLRYWRLIELRDGATLTASPLRIDERVLHFLAGVQHLDERLVGLIEPLPMSDELTPSHQVLADELAAIWDRATEEQVLPILQLCGAEAAGKRAVAAAAADLLGMELHRLPAQAVPASAVEREALARLWTREAILGNSVLLLDCDGWEPAESEREAGITALIEEIHAPLIISSRARRATSLRPSLAVDVYRPTHAEQVALWQQALGPAAADLDGAVEALADHFNLSRPAILATCSAIAGPGSEGATPRDGQADNLAGKLWATCRAQARPQLGNLAQHIQSSMTWDDLVLPAVQKQTLRDVALHVRRRQRVYEGWGFAAKSGRGLGISALFTGASGTGKTLAAEVLANELRLDLLRIDLSAVVSKYIGETEKNLARLFDAAEGSGAILLFDEADALFGKRSEVKDSHDRYANIEISYLLQRMEAYRGLAILTTNQKEALDTAFLRRIRFIVRFPFPDGAQRAQIWQRIFPAETPTNGLDVARLAQLNVAGGNIRNIALSAAFLAADEDGPVDMGHLLAAARAEYSKLEKSLTGTEIKGWR